MPQLHPIIPVLRNRPLSWGVLIAVGLVVAPELTPFDPNDLGAIELRDARRPPWFFAGSDARFPLGTDRQGRDLLSALAHGARTSVAIALTATLLAAVVGTGLGLLSSTGATWRRTLIGRAGELQLAYPAVVAALLIHAAVTALFPGGMPDATTGFAMVVSAIALGSWPEFAAVARAKAATLWRQDYVTSAVAIGASDHAILWQHIWPGVRSAVAALALAVAVRAIAIEATLSYLGTGLPAAHPTLGGLIRTGQPGLLSGHWWMAGIPILVLIGLCLGLASLASTAQLDQQASA